MLLWVNVESPGNNPVHGLSQFNTCTLGGDTHWNELLMSGNHHRAASVMFNKAQHVRTEHECYFIRHPQVVKIFPSAAPAVNACLSSSSHMAGSSSHVACSRRFASSPHSLCTVLITRVPVIRAGNRRPQAASMKSFEVGCTISSCNIAMWQSPSCH